MLCSNVRYGINFHKEFENVTFQSTLEYYPGLMLSCVAFSIALEYYPGVLLSCVAFGIAFRQDSGNVTLWSTLAYYPGVLPWSIALQGHTPNVMPETLLWAML